MCSFVQCSMFDNNVRRIWQLDIYICDSIAKFIEKIDWSNDGGNIRKNVTHGGTWNFRCELIIFRSKKKMEMNVCGMNLKLESKCTEYRQINCKRIILLINGKNYHLKNFSRGKFKSVVGVIHFVACLTTCIKHA